MSRSFSVISMFQTGVSLELICFSTYTCLKAGGGVGSPPLDFYDPLCRREPALIVHASGDCCLLITIAYGMDPFLSRPDL